jgi:hypothetical protein
MKLKKRIFKKYFIIQLLIVAIYIMVVFPAFRAGEEFQVNTCISSWQDHPAVAMDEEGNFVITWESSEQDGDHWGIFAQRFDKEGFPIGPEFQVNTHYESYQATPEVAMDEKGNFVIIWISCGQDGDDWGIYAQRFKKNGKASGPEFQVNTHYEDTQGYPAVAMDAKGNFVITWESWDGGDSDVFAQKFKKNGKASGPEFQVNTYSAFTQRASAIAMDKEGNFVITWESSHQDGDGKGIFAQRFDKEGLPIGPEFQVNTYIAGSQWNPSVAMDEEGNFVITWISWGQEGLYGDGDEIFAQRFDKEGLPIGPEFKVNGYYKSHQSYPAVAMDKEGNFVITWESKYQDGDEYGIFARRFDKEGWVIGPEFQVNTYIGSDQRLPAVAMDKGGNFVITWESEGQDGDGMGVFAKMFKIQVEESTNNNSYQNNH